MADVLELDYQLAELPSSQHRAGLAGLVLMARWLERLKKTDHALQGTCQITRLDEHGMTLRLDQAGLQEIFDETFAALKETRESDKPPAGKNAEYRIEERTVTDKSGKAKVKTFYVYEIVIPRGAFLLDYDPTSDGEKGIWINLWRAMLFSVVRGRDKQRLSFKARASGSTPDDAQEMWDALAKRQDVSVKMPSTFFIGAEDSNAENVPFKDRARFKLLLHFWPFVAQIYVPIILSYDNKTKKTKPESRGYAITIPDVSNLVDFCAGLPTVLQRERRPDAHHYFRSLPDESVIDSAAEGALDLMSKLSQRLAVEAANQSVGDLLLGVDVLHLEKKEKTVRLRGIARVDPMRSMIDEYARVRRIFRDPLFRRQRVLNVLNGREWFVGFGRLLSTTDIEQTISSRFFCADARAAFIDFLRSNQPTKGEHHEMETDATKQVDDQPLVAELIYQLVGTYISAKLKSKYENELKAVQGTPKEADYKKEKRAKIAKDAFLSVRSRTGDDFIEYFASTLCSFPQFLSEDGYATLARALHTDTDKVRTLTLLALSARG
jgi:CRISPR-associated protein Cmx8